MRCLRIQIEQERNERMVRKERMWIRAQKLYTLRKRRYGWTETLFIHPQLSSLLFSPFSTFYFLSLEPLPPPSPSLTLPLRPFFRTLQTLTSRFFYLPPTLALLSFPSSSRSSLVKSFTRTKLRNCKTAWGLLSYSSTLILCCWWLASREAGRVQLGET